MKSCCIKSSYLNSRVLENSFISKNIWFALIFIILPFKCSLAYWFSCPSITNDVKILHISYYNRFWSTWTYAAISCSWRIYNANFWHLFELGYFYMSKIIHTVICMCVHVCLRICVCYLRVYVWLDQLWRSLPCETNGCLVNLRIKSIYPQICWRRMAL